MDKLNEGRCVTGHLHNEVVQQVQVQLVDDNTATRLAELFKAMSDPTRVRIISALSASELCVCRDLTPTARVASAAVGQEAQSGPLHLLFSRRRACVDALSRGNGPRAAWLATLPTEARSTRRSFWILCALAYVVEQLLSYRNTIILRQSK